MRFEKLTIRNFLSFGDEEQTLTLAKQGLVLIEGDNQDDPTVDNNGAGKSAIFEALLWVLYGRTIRYGASGDSVVNERAEKNCSVKLTLIDDKGKEYRIERYRKDAEHKNRLRLYGPRRELTSSDSSVTQAKIVEIVGADFVTFTNSVVFGQGVIKHFAAMTDKEQKAVMDRLVGVEALSLAHKKARERVKELEGEIEDYEQDGAEAELRRLKGDLREAEEDSEEWEEEQARLVKKARAAWKRHKAPSTKEAKARQRKAGDRLTAARAALEEARQGASEVWGKLQAAREAVSQASRRLSKVMKGEGVCDSCGGKVTRKSLAKHRKEIEAEQAKAKEAEEALSEEFEKWSRKRRTATAEHAEAEEERDDAEEALQKALVAGKEKERLRERYLAAKGAENPHTKLLARLQREMEKVEAKVKKQRKHVAKLKEDLRYAEFSVVMFSDKGTGSVPALKGCLLDAVAPFLNEQAARYSRHLTEGNIEVTFSTVRTLKSGEMRDDFGVQAVNRHGSSVYAGASGGEKRKIDVIVALALQSLGAARAKSQFNLAFYDEIFESLDETATEYVMDLLLEERRNRSSLFVVTHKPSLKVHFPRAITVQKVNGTSRIV